MAARPPQQLYTLPPGAKDFESSGYVQYVDPPISTISDLDNEIHPIFDKCKFSPDFDYDVMKMSLRLATRILESDPAVAYIVTMIDGDVFTLNPGTNSGPPSWTLSTLMDVARTNDLLQGGKPFARFPREEDSELTDATRRRARQILDQLVGAIDGYKLRSSGSSRAAAWCKQGPPVSAETAEAFPTGVSSTILMSKENYELMAHLHESHIEGTPPSKALLLQRFNAADNLVHELGHAIAYAGSGLACNWNDAPYYMNSPIDENGYDFANDIWDGILNADASEQGSVIMSEWPSDIRLASHRERNSLITCLHANMRPNEITHRVPIKFIENLSTNAFWTESVDGKGVKALRAPIVGTWGFKRVNKETVPCDVEDLVNPDLLSIRHRVVLGRSMELQSHDPETGRANVSRLPGELHVRPQINRGR